MEDHSNRDIRQLARILNLSKNLKLDQDVNDVLFDYISLDSSSENISQNNKNDNRHSDLEAVFHQLVNENAPWLKLQPLGREILDLKDDKNKFAAELIELAVIHGSKESALKEFNYFFNLIPNFYFSIHKDIRTAILIDRWSIGQAGKIAKMVLSHKSEKITLNEIEKLFVLLCLIKDNNKETVIKYYLNNQSPIEFALDEYSSKLKLPIDHLHFNLAKIAKNQNNSTKAMELFRSIPIKSKFYTESQNYIKQANDEMPLKSIEEWFKEFNDESDYLSKLSIFEQNIQNRLDEGLENSNKKISLMLNQLNSFKNAPAQGVVEFIKTLTNLAPIVSSVESIENLFIRRALSFSVDNFQLKFWSEFRNVNQHKNPFWFFVADLNLFMVEIDSKNEDDFWKLYSEFNQIKKQNLKFTWSQIASETIEFLLSSQSISSSQKTKFQILFNFTEITEEKYKKVVNDYIESTLFHSTSFDHIQSILTKTKNESLSLRLELKKIQSSYYKNIDLSHMWKVSNEDKNWDLSWRVATVAKSREVLSKITEPCWSVSGEYREEYTYINFNQEDIDLCLNGISRDHSEFLKSYLIIGPKISNLMSMLSANSRQLKSPKILSKNQKKARDILNQQSWYKSNKGKYEFIAGNARVSAEDLPPFLSRAVDRTWCFLYLSIFSYYGFYSWNWDLKILEKKSRLAQPNTCLSVQRDSHPYKITRWLRSLNSTERSAWGKVTRLAKNIDNTKLLDDIAVVIARVSLLIYPNHYQALKSLQKMNSLLPVIRKFEYFLLSKEYSEYRKDKKITNSIKVNVPIQSLDLIK